MVPLGIFFVIVGAPYFGCAVILGAIDYPLAAFVCFLMSMFRTSASPKEEL